MGEGTKNRSKARIIGIVTASNRKDPGIWKALAECDWVEFRADTFAVDATFGADPSRSGSGAGAFNPAAVGGIAGQLASFREECRRFNPSLRILFTIRLRRDGGAWPDDRAADREAVWNALGLDGSNALCDWLDVETEAFASLSKAFRRTLTDGKTPWLLSHHNMRAGFALDDARKMLSDMRACKPHGMKFAVTCAHRDEAAALLGFAREAAMATSHGCVLSMGAPGRATRALSPLLGCPLTYGYLTGGAVAPGQLSAAELAAFYRAVDDARGAEGGLPQGSDETLLDWAEARIAGAKLAP